MALDGSGFHHVRLGRRTGGDGVGGEVLGGVVYQTPHGSLFGLPPVGDCAFDSTRTGLDHVSFAVADRSALEAARTALRDAGVRTERSSS